MSESAVFDHYEVLRKEDGSLFELGRGAMGTTYKAFDRNLRCHVALKVINAAYLESEVARQRFVREARSAAQLRHRNVASVFHLGVERDAYFYAMEFIDGETVEALIRRKGPLEPVFALRIAAQVARALGAAQKHQLVHRDIKPANLMLVHEDDELLVKVIDFGLAKSSRSEEGDATLSMGGFVGTPHFASPEQLEEREIDQRSDIYSLGVTLWYMLAGKAPFAGSIAQVMSQHLHKPPPFEQFGNLPAPVVDVLEHMLEKDPDKRPQTSAELRAELERCIATLETGAVEFPTVVGALSRAGIGPGVTVAGRYRVIRKLGEDATGQWFGAEEPGGVVRLLVLEPGLGDLAELERETQRLRQVQHPNLIRVLGLEHHEHRAVLVFEAVEGITLRDLLRNRRQLEMAEVLSILGQASAGVDFATQAGLTRLDISLQATVVQDSTGGDGSASRRYHVAAGAVVKLNPLAVSRGMAEQETWAGEQTLVGRSSVSGLAQAGPVQALAALVYELLGGAPVPVGIGGARGRYIPLPALSEAGNEVLKRALEQGFPSAGEFFQALNATDRTGNRLAPAVSAAEWVVLPASPLAPVGKKKGPVVLIAGIGLAGAGIGVMLFLSVSRPQIPTAAVKPEATPVSTPAISPAPTPVPIATPTPPPVPSPTPAPTPDKQELLRSAVAEAETFEANQDWARCISAFVAIARNYPESDIGKVRLEMILTRLRATRMTPESFAPLREALTESASLGLVPAMAILGENLRKTDPELAFNWWCAAAALGDAPALTQVGLFYSDGTGTPRSLEKAFWWFEQASAKGDALGKACLGECYLLGKGTPRDERKAFLNLSEAASAGNLRSMDRLGTLFQKGIGTAKDFAEASRLFTKASELGHLDSLGNLGVLFMNGEGVPADARKAVALFERGARKENPYCMYLYARCLENGIGVEANPADAKGWYKRAAGAGQIQALEWCRKNNIGLAPN